MAEAHSRTAPRRKRGTLNVGFRVRFAERCYDACSRWYNDDWQKHVSGVPQDPRRLLDREKEVKEEVDRVHSDQQYYKVYSTFLQTCVDPTCTIRGWEAVELDGGTDTWVAAKRTTEARLWTTGTRTEPGRGCAPNSVRWPKANGTTSNSRAAHAAASVRFFPSRPLKTSGSTFLRKPARP